MNTPLAIRMASLVLVTSTAAVATPILLATMDARVSLGTPQVVESAWPFLYYLRDNPHCYGPLFEQDALEPPFPIQIDQTVSAANDPDFPAFAAMLSDGVNELIMKGAWDQANGPLGGAGGEESFDLNYLVARFGPDLVGYEVECIRLVALVDMHTPGTDPQGDGIWTDWAVLSGQYEFYGVAAPEPASAVLLLGVAVAVLANRRCPRRFA
jgi:hypothetical protein